MAWIREARRTAMTYTLYGATVDLAKYRITDIDQYPHIDGLHARDLLLGDVIRYLLSLSSWSVGKEWDDRIVPHNLLM
jgi:hypothetical protein